MSEENLNKKFEEEFNKLSEKDKREVNNLIRFMHEKKYHDSQYEELLNQYIELSRDYEKSQNIIKEVREYIEKHTYKWYDLNGEEYKEPTMFDKNANPKVILEILDRNK